MPESLEEIFGDLQFAGFAEVIVPLLCPTLFGFDDTVLKNRPGLATPFPNLDLSV